MKCLENITQKRKGGFLSGVVVLTASTILVKILGLVYRIPMLRLLGAEGMGYFNTSFELYALIAVTATAGLPVALSVRISGSLAGGRYGEVQKTYRTALALFLAVGLAGAAVLAFGSVPLAAFLKSGNARPSILAIAPALFFTCAAGALRGYFQGFGNMVPTAVSQLIEAAGKLVFGLLFANLAASRGAGTPIITAFAVIGFGVGTAVALVYLIAEKKRQENRVPGASEPVAESVFGKPEHVLRGLLALALPVTLASSVTGFNRILDMTLILRRLQTIGYDASAANELYGAYTTLALPVFHLVPSLITSVALPLLPSVASARESGDRDGERSVISSALRLTALLALPASLALTAFARPVLELLFRGQKEAVSVSAPLLSMLGVSVFFSCLMTVAGAVLQAYHRVLGPIRAMAIGIVVKAISAYLLIGIPSVGISGAPLSTFLCGFAVTAVEMYHVVKNAPDGLSFRDLFFRPFAAATVSVGAATVFALFLPGAMEGRGQTLLLFAACAAIYLLLVLAFGAATPDQLKTLVQRRKQPGK